MCVAIDSTAQFPGQFPYAFLWTYVSLITTLILCQQHEAHPDAEAILRPMITMLMLRSMQIGFAVSNGTNGGNHCQTTAATFSAAAQQNKLNEDFTFTVTKAEFHPYNNTGIKETSLIHRCCRGGGKSNRSTHSTQWQGATPRKTRTQQCTPSQHQQREFPICWPWRQRS